MMSLNGPPFDAPRVLLTSVPGWVEIVFLLLVAGVVWFVLAGLRGRRCLYCRKRNRPEAVYCAECGHRLDKPPKTPA